MNSLYQQVTGLSDITATDFTGLIAMGAKIKDLKLTDAFFGALTDYIARDVVPSREYNVPDDMGLLVSNNEWGALIRKYYIDPPEASEAIRWNLQDGQTVNQDIVKKLNVYEDIFTGIDPWDIEYTLPMKQLQSAFDGLNQMNAFINGIYVAIQNASKVKQMALQRMVVSNFAGELLASTDGGIHKIDVLASYNAATGGALTAAEALTDPAFHRHLAMTINNYIKFLQEPSAVFNTKNRVRFTPKRDMRVQMLGMVGSAADIYLQSDVYHNELTSLPNYRELMSWQGNNKTYDFNELSRINITTSSGKVVNQTGVIALITDYDAMGITFMREDVNAHVNQRGDFTNFFLHYDTGYYNDLSENGVVFVMQDTQPTP